MGNALLTIHGSSVDEFYEAAYWPVEGNYAGTLQRGKAAGGPPLNVGCICASHGSKVYALDYLNENDDSSDFIISQLQKQGVDTSNIQRGSCVNGKVIIFTTGEKRTMFVVHPKRPFYTVDDKLQQLLNSHRYIYSMMHVIRRSFENIAPLLQAKKQGVKIILDGCAMFDEAWEKELLFALADGLFMNTTDYQHLCDHCDFDPKEKLLQQGAEFVCITDGENGAECYTQEGHYHAGTIATNVVDSTGAGDSFAGTFLYGRLKGYGWQHCLNLACAGGSYACTILGGQGGCCSEEKLLKYAEEHHYCID